MTSDLGARNRASRDRLAAVIARLGGRSVELPGGWTAAAVLAHLAFWDAFVAARLEKFARDRGPMEPGSDALTDLMNAAGLPQWLALPAAAAGELATGAAAAVDRLIEGLPTDALDEIERALR